MDSRAEIFEFYVEGVLLFIIAVFGIIGNIVFILIFSCSRDINTFHRSGSFQVIQLRAREGQLCTGRNKKNVNNFASLTFPTILTTILPIMKFILTV